jgi:hypothetical protein
MDAKPVLNIVKISIIEAAPTTGNNKKTSGK